MDKLEDVLRRAEGKLDEEDFAMVKALADAYAYLTEVVGDRNTSIARLRKLLFARRPKRLHGCCVTNRRAALRRRPAQLSFR